MAERYTWRAAALALLLLAGPAAGHTDLARLLPAPSSLEGWRAAEGPAEYVPGTLYELIDGAAPRYLTYGFRRLVHVRYQLGEDPLACVTLDVFDMGSELGAFGIYRSGLSSGSALREWGAEGHRTGTLAAAWKGDVYVRAEADDDRAELIEMVDRLVARVCDEVAGDASRPAILAPLPAEGLVPRSERYVAEDLLGHAFLPGGVLATYEFEGDEARLFFSDLGSEAAVGEAMVMLRAHQERRGTIEREVPSIGAGGFRFSDPDLGNGTVAGAGRFVAGVHGRLPQKEQERLLGRLLESLGSS
jgi:hypothetical protein